MTNGSSLIQQLDLQIEKLLSGWNIYSTILAVALVTYLLYPIFFTQDPDTHPLLLACQATISPVRQPGESAIFRALETPHGYPLKTGLNVKDPGAPKWAAGRDGDLRDIWKQALKGPVGPDEKEIGSRGKVLTVLGKEEIIEYDFSRLTKEINAVGNFMKGHTGSRVAIYLPNSVEFLVTLFGNARVMPLIAIANDHISCCVLWVYPDIGVTKAIAGKSRQDSESNTGRSFSRSCGDNSFE